MGYYAVQGHSRSPILVHMRLPINSNLHPISHRFEIIADYCSYLVRKTATLRFEAPFGGLYAVHLRLIGKLVVNFLLVTIDFFR